MATVKISELSSSANITADDFFPVVDSSVTKKATAAIMKDFVLGRSGSNSTIHISSSDAIQISANNGIQIIGTTSLTGSLSGTATSASFATTASHALNTFALNRNAVSASIVSMTADQVVTGSVTDFGKSFLLLSTTVNTHSRIRLYGSQSFRTSDLSRPIGTDPSANSGVIADLVLSGSPSLFNYTLSPIANGANMDPVTIPTIYYTVTNLSGTTTDVSMSFNRIVLE